MNEAHVKNTPKRRGDCSFVYEFHPKLLGGLPRPWLRDSLFERFRRLFDLLGGLKRQVVRMSSIGDVKVGEKRVKEITDKLRGTSPKDDTSILQDQLKNATDEYSKAVLELKLP